MIIVVKYYQRENLGRKEKEGWFVSHGIDTETLSDVILPNDRWEHFSHNCDYSKELDEWVLK